MERREMYARALIIGGTGAVGGLFCRFFINAGVKTVCLDLQIPPKEKRIEHLEYIESDASHFDINLLQEVTLVLVAVPERLAHKVVAKVLPLLGSHQCLIETTSVKTEISGLMCSLKPHSECISINPMFGPALGFKNQSIAWMGLNSGPISQWFRELIEQAGCHVVMLDADEHDKNTVAIQAATHAAIIAFGMTLLSLDYNPGSSKHLWTPPHKVLLALLSRLFSIKPDVFIEIQSKNPNAMDMRQHMIDNMQRLSEIIKADSQDEIEIIFDDLRAMISDEADPLNNLFQNIFSK